MAFLWLELGLSSFGWFMMCRAIDGKRPQHALDFGHQPLVEPLAHWLGCATQPHHMETHYGLVEGRCLLCDREFNLMTSPRNHCKKIYAPQCLPKLAPPAH